MAAASISACWSREKLPWCVHGEYAPEVLCALCAILLGSHMDCTAQQDLQYTDVDTRLWLIALTPVTRVLLASLCHFRDAPV